MISFDVENNNRNFSIKLIRYPIRKMFRIVREVFSNLSKPFNVLMIR